MNVLFALKKKRLAKKEFKIEKELVKSVKNMNI